MIFADQMNYFGRFFKLSMPETSWVRRRWFDFRLGHGMYLIFAMSFANFILIFYRLLVERIEFLAEIITNLGTFVIILLITYVPLAILIGNWHKKTQIKVDQEQVFRRSPYLAEAFRVIIDILDGKTTKEEIEKYRKFLISIEKDAGGF